MFKYNLLFGNQYTITDTVKLQLGIVINLVAELNNIFETFNIYITHHYNLFALLLIR